MPVGGYFIFRRMKMAKKSPITIKSAFYSVLSLAWILFVVAFGHIIMSVIEHYYYEGRFLFGIGCFIVGMLGLIITRFCKHDGWQSFWGVFGGSFIWTAWEYSLIYGSERIGVPFTYNGSWPEYRLMNFSFGAYVMVCTYLLFQESVRCNFFLFFRRAFGLMRGAVATGKVDNYGPRTSFEYIVCTWTSYLLLMIAYDEQLFGVHSWFCYFVFFFSWGYFFYLCYILLTYDKFGANLRYAIPTAIVVWNTIEILAKWGMLTDPWGNMNWPIMTTLLVGLALSTWLIIRDLRAKKAQAAIEQPDIVK